MDVCYLDEVPEKVDSGLPFDIGDLPPDIRLKIDEIVRNNEDFEAQIDAIDALLFGRRDPIDADNESGIDVESNSSNTASIASSSDYSVVGGGSVIGGWADPSRQTMMTTTAVSYPLRVDDAVDHQHAVQLGIPPPPDFFQESKETDELGEFSPAGGFELPPPIEFTPSFVLPTLIEVPEDETRNDSLCIPAPDYDAPGVGGDCIPPPLEFNSTELPSVVASSSAAITAEAKRFQKNCSSNSTNAFAPVPSRAPLNQHGRSLSIPPIIAPKPLLIKQSSTPKECATDSGSGVLAAEAEQHTLTSAVRMTQEQNRPNVNGVAASNGFGPIGGGSTSPVTVSVGVPAKPVIGETNTSVDSNVMPLNGNLTNVPRRFQGITETQKKETVVEQKKKQNFLQKWLRRGSSTSSTVDFVENADAITTPSDNAHRFSQTLSSKRNPTKTPENGFSDFVSSTATLPRSSASGEIKAKPLSGVNRMSLQLTKEAVRPGGENKLPLHESISAPSFPLPPNPSSTLTTDSSEVSDPLSRSSRLEPDENAVINIEDVQWSSDEEDDTKNNSEESDGTTDEDEDEITILRKVKLRPQFRDKSGRLTIGPSSMEGSRSKSTSMMTLNQVGSRSTFSPTSNSRTTDDIASLPVTKNIESGIMTLQRYNKKHKNSNGVFNHSAVSLGVGSSQRTLGKSPKSGRSTTIDNSSLEHNGVVTDEDELLGLRRSDYLPSTSISSSGPLTSTTSVASMRSPSALTDRLLRRSMLVTSYDFSSMLDTDMTSSLSALPLPQTNSFSNSVISDQKSAVQLGESSVEENKFNTFRGAIKPMKWLEDRSEPLVMRRSGINTISGYGGVSKSKQRMSVPPEWIIVKSPDVGNTAEMPILRHEVEQLMPTKTVANYTKPSIRPRPKTGDGNQHWKNVENVEIPVPRFESRIQPVVSTRELETVRSADVRQEVSAVPSQQNLSDSHDSKWLMNLPPDSDDIPPPPMEFLSNEETTDVAIPIAPPIFGHYPEDLAIVESRSLQANLPRGEVMASESIAIKTYGNRAIHEALIDTRSILIDLNLTKSSLLGNISVDTVPPPVSMTPKDQTLPSIVRQFVADSKNFVAVASATNSELAQSNGQMHQVTESAMRRLAAMSVACRRLTVASLTSHFAGGEHLVVPLPTVVAVVDYAIDVVTVFGDMLDAARLVVDSRSDAGRRFAVDSLNGHAVSLARALVGFVQRTRTM